jgi:hypothetical protein
MRRLSFWAILVALLLVVTVAGAEAIASLFVPSWPARMLRPIEPALAGKSSNSWGLIDKERSIERPPNAFRSVFIGDSFLEALPDLSPLPQFVEKRVARQPKIAEFEAINLGVSATSPRHYYYRLKHIGLKLRPDVIFMFFYSGNDFIYETIGGLPPFIAELPQPSLLGAVAPRLTWLTVNRLGLSEFRVRNKAIPGEHEMLNGWLKEPRGQLIDKVVRHMKAHYYPTVEESVLREIYSRNGGSYWDAFVSRGPESEQLFAWALNGLVDWELGSWRSPRTEDEGDQMVDPKTIDASLGWLLGAQELANQQGVKLVAFIIPPGTVDPKYVDYWRPWARYYGASVGSDARHRSLVGRLRQTKLPFVDLRDDLMGKSGTYRLIDGHWTEAGKDIVADRAAKVLAPLIHR